MMDYEFSLNLWVIPLGFASIQGIFLSVLISLHKTGDPFANRLLALLTMTIALILGYMTLFISNQIQNFPHLIWITSPLWYIIGPLFYIYIKLRLNLNFSLFDSIHFIPFVYKLISMIPFYLLDSMTKVQIYQQYANFNTFTYSTFMHYLLTAFYILISYIKLNKNLPMIKDRYSNSIISTIEFHKKLALIFGISIVILYVAILSAVAFDAYGIEFDYIGLTCLSILIYTISISVIRSPNTLFIELNKLNIVDDQEINPKIKDEITKIIQEQKPYLNPELKLVDFANLLNITPHEMSFILNKHYQKSFYQFINFFRVECAKEKLKSEDLSLVTILSVALDCGFNSKASFNRIFKQFTNQTPSSFIKS